MRNSPKKIVIEQKDLDTIRDFCKNFDIPEPEFLNKYDALLVSGNFTLEDQDQLRLDTAKFAISIPSILITDKVKEKCAEVIKEG